MDFGEVVIGPPGSGKTTYIIKSMQNLRRKSIAISLDPGNETCDFFGYSICKHFITKEYMEKTGLGPNYALKEIMVRFAQNVGEYLGPVIDQNKGCFFVFDFPGQIELFISSGLLADVLAFFTKKGISFVVVNLFDVVHFYDSFSRISSYVVATLSMMLIEAPQVCVISKCDNIKRYGKSFDLETIADVDMCYSEDVISSTKFLKESIAFVESMSILKFQVLDIENYETWLLLQLMLDEASGYAYENEIEVQEIYKGLPSRSSIIDKYNFSEST